MLLLDLFVIGQKKRCMVYKQIDFRNLYKYPGLILCIMPDCVEISCKMQESYFKFLL